MIIRERQTQLTGISEKRGLFQMLARSSCLQLNEISLLNVMFLTCITAVYTYQLMLVTMVVN